MEWRTSFAVPDRSGVPSGVACPSRGAPQDLECNEVELCLYDWDDQRMGLDVLLGSIKFPLQNVEGYDGTPVDPTRPPVREYALRAVQVPPSLHPRSPSLVTLTQRCIRREGPRRRPQKRLRRRLEGVAKAVGGRLLSVTNAVEPGTWRQGDSG